MAEAFAAALVKPIDPPPAPVNPTGPTEADRAWLAAHSPSNATGYTVRRKAIRTSWTLDAPRSTFAPCRDWTRDAEPCEVRGAWSGHPAECV